MVRPFHIADRGGEEVWDRTAARADIRGEPGNSFKFSEPVIGAAGPVQAFAGPKNSKAVDQPMPSIFVTVGVLGRVTGHRT